MSRKRFVKASELLEAATPLYGVGDGTRTRSMLNAVQAAHHDLFNAGQEWRDAMTALDLATTGDESVLNGFQSWEHQEGRTVEECRAAFRRSIPIAAEIERKRRDAEMNSYCHC